MAAIQTGATTRYCTKDKTTSSSPAQKHHNRVRETQVCSRASSGRRGHLPRRPAHLRQDSAEPKQRGSHRGPHHRPAPRALTHPRQLQPPKVQIRGDGRTRSDLFGYTQLFGIQTQQ